MLQVAAVKLCERGFKGNLKGCLQRHNSTQLNSARQREQQLTQFVGHDVINKNTTDLAVHCLTGSVELSCVAINIPLGVHSDCVS